MNELHLFAGAGGGILGGMLIGHTCVCAVEIDPYCRRVLLQRQRDGSLPRFPIWDDIRTFDANPWRGRVDIVAGGFPCQDISVAGRGRGIDGTRSGLWAEMARVVREAGPTYVLVENSPALTARGLGRVLGDLASVGYDAEWDMFSAAGVGAPHLRRRLWILAYTESEQAFRLGSRRLFNVVAVSGENVPDSPGDGRQPRRAEPAGSEGRPEAVECSASSHSDVQGLAQREGQPGDNGPQQPSAERAGWWEFEPGLGRMADWLATELDAHGLTAGESIPRVAVGVRDRVKRLRAIGNGQVPAVAARAFTELLRKTKNGLD